MSKTDMKKLTDKIEKLERENRLFKKTEKELLKNQQILKEQNRNLVRKSIELSDIKRELEDKNYELESYRAELKDQNVNIIRKSIALSDAMRQIEDKNYDLNKSKNDLEKLLLELSESEKKFKDLANMLPEVVFEIEKSGKFTFVNQGALRLFGYSQKELYKGMDVFQVFVPEDHDKLIELQKDLYSAQKSVSAELMALGKDGRTFPVLVYCNLIVKDGEIEGIRGFAIDMEIQKQAEEALRKSEEKYRSLTENINVGIYRTTSGPEGRLVEANKALVRMLGYNSKEELMKIKIANLYLDPKSRNSFSEEILIKGSVFYNEIQLKKKDGTIIICSDSAVSFEDKVTGERYFDGILEDITDRKNAEEDLRESEEKYRDLFENANDLIQSVDPNGYYIYVNKKWLETLGYTEDQIRGLRFTDVIRKDQLPHCYEIFNKVCQGESIDTVETVFISSKGNEISVEGNINAQIKDGIFIGTRGIFRDITKRKQAEESLHESERFSSTILNNSPNPIIGINPDTSIKFVNRALEDITGYSSKELIGVKAPYPWWSEEFKKDVMKELQKALLEGAMNLEQQFVNKNGEHFWVDINSIPVSLKEKRFYYLSVWTDITNKKKTEDEKRLLQKQLLESQKMESIGRLAGGVAHDFNNILSAIMGYSDLLRQTFSDTSNKEGKAVDVIYRSTLRARTLIRQLLGFSRKGKYNPEPVSLNNIIKDSVIVSENIFEKKIEIIYELEENLRLCDADKNQMEQVLTNLIINARDAMPDGGKIVFRTENLTIDEDMTKIYPNMFEKNVIKVSISDTGFGIPEDYRDKIFEPFFTTKGVGEGTGLGLATVYGIITNHNGHIEVSSSLGKGSTFTFYLPVSETLKIHSFEEQNVIVGDKTILVVDDEKELRSLLLEQLESIGYSVILASDGLEAVRIYQKNKDDIDLILLDMIMPGLDGKDTFLALKKIDPEVKVLLLSGYSQDERAIEILTVGVIDFIQKPIELSQLSKVINDALKT